MHSVLNRSGDWKTFYNNAPVTSIIIIVNTIMLLITILAGGFSAVNLARLGGIVPIFVKNGEYWRIITGAFLHGGLFHFLANIVIGLLSLSSALERMIGSKKFAVIYFGSLIVSGILVVIFSSPFTVTIGASGAIFGVLGCLLYIIVYRKDMMSQRDASSIASLVILNLIITFFAPLFTYWMQIGSITTSVPSISFWGHIGGIVSGFILSFLLIKRNVFKVIN